MNSSGVTVQVRHHDQSVVVEELQSLTLELFDQAVPWRKFRDYRGQRHYSGSYWSATMEALVGVPRQVVGRISSVSKVGVVGSARPRCTSSGRFQAIAS